MSRRSSRPPRCDLGSTRVVTTAAVIALVALGGVAGALATRSMRPPEPPVVTNAPVPTSGKATASGTGAAQLSPTAAVDHLRGSVARLLTTRHPDAAAAVVAWNEMAGALVGAGEAADPQTASAAMSLELAKAVSTPQGRATLAATEAALDGKVLSLPDSRSAAGPSAGSNDAATGSATGAATGGGATGGGATGGGATGGGATGGGATGAGLIRAAATNPGLHVYYINGVMNDLVMATQGAYQLEQAFGVHVDLAYDRSILEVDQYALDLCMRGIVARYRESGGVADFGNSTLSSLVTEADRNLEAAGDAALTVACTTADAVLNSANLARQKVKDVLDSGAQLTLQWLADSRVVSASVNQDLERLVKGYLQRGDRAILVGHSQGTLFVRQALEDLRVWWPKAYANGEIAGCEPDPGEQPPTPAPVAALYISPAFWAKDADSADLNSGLQRYVALDGDVLGRLKVAWVRPTASPDAQQRSIWPGYNALKLHFLDTYLMSPQQPRVSRTQIVDGFGELQDALADLDPTKDCQKKTPTVTGSSTPGATDPAGSAWVAWRALKPFEGIGINVSTKRDYLAPQIARKYSGGGRDPNATFTKELLIAQEFGSQDAAMKALCSGLTDVRMWPLGTGMHGVWKGTAYPLGNTVHCD